MGCRKVWTNPAPSAAVPKLSTIDGDIYTVQGTTTGTTQNYALTAIEFATGQTLSTQALGTGPSGTPANSPASPAPKEFSTRARSPASPKSNPASALPHPPAPAHHGHAADGLRAAASEQHTGAAD